MCTNTCWNLAAPDAQLLWMETYICGLNGGCYNDATGSWGGYAGAETAVSRWAAINGCGDTTTAGEPLDLVHELVGVDTHPTSYDGCPYGLNVALWSIEHGKHAPGFNANWSSTFLEWLLEQQKMTVP